MGCHGHATKIGGALRDIPKKGAEDIPGVTLNHYGIINANEKETKHWNNVKCTRCSTMRQTVWRNRKNEISVNNNYTIIQRKWEIIKQSNARTLAHLQACTLVRSNRLKCTSNVQFFLNVTVTKGT